MTEKAKSVVAEAISKMKNAMFDHMANAEPGIHSTCTFTIPVDDLVILEREAIQLERDYVRLREALEFYAYKNNYFTVDMYAESIVHMEGGEKARKALEEVNK